MSLDGFIAGPGDNMAWVFKHAGPNDEVDEVVRTTGAVLVGRRSYDVGHREDTPPGGRKVYGGAWAGPQFGASVDLQLLGVTRSGQLANLRFRVVR